MTRNRMIVSSDQGVVVTVNGGRTWSSWYNQPTAQLYHISTDDRFPYWIYGSQQDSGSVAIISRSLYLGINSHSWRPIDVGGESEYLAPDPLNPEILYGGSDGTTVTRFNLLNDQNQDISPILAHPGVYRYTWTLPLVFSAADPHALYFGSQVVFAPPTAGKPGGLMSPDLTRSNPGIPPNLDSVTAADTAGGNRRGVVYTIAPSPLAAGTIWAGTDDGLIQLTRNGGRTWRNVTPPGLTAWSKISMMEASPFDAETAYAAVDRHRLDDFRPYIYRTRNGGKTWQQISRGIPMGSFVRVVREDPVRKGLLYAGTETGVYVSFDDGNHWQSLQLNLPCASVRDLRVQGDDLVAATHGRSIWVLDDLAPLRQLDAQVASSNAWFFRPAKAYRIRSGTDEGTPLPHDEPAGQNPPTGAILDYYLKSKPAGPVVLEIDDLAGNLVRRFSSSEKVKRVNAAKLQVAASWVRQKQLPSAKPGMHRFVWDLLYPNAPIPTGFDLWAKSGLWAVPGQYTAKLIVDGKTYSQPLAVAMDPRVKVSLADLKEQFDVTRQIVGVRAQVSQALVDAQALQKRLERLQPEAENHPKLKSALDAIERRMPAVLGPVPPSNPDFSGEFGPSRDRASLRYLKGAFGKLEHAIESADAAPTPDALTAFHQNLKVMQSTMVLWLKIKTEDLAKLNAVLQRMNRPAVVPWKAHP